MPRGRPRKKVSRKQKEMDKPQNRRDNWFYRNEDRHRIAPITDRERQQMAMSRNKVIHTTIDTEMQFMDKLIRAGNAFIRKLKGEKDEQRERTRPVQKSSKPRPQKRS